MALLTPEAPMNLILIIIKPLRSHPNRIIDALLGHEPGDKQRLPNVCLVREHCIPLFGHGQCKRDIFRENENKGQVRP
jgi:hypothetical protein